MTQTNPKKGLIEKKNLPFTTTCFFTTTYCGCIGLIYDLIFDWCGGVGGSVAAVVVVVVGGSVAPVVVVVFVGGSFSR
jgi:hypothetical protein